MTAMVAVRFREAAIPHQCFSAAFSRTNPENLAAYLVRVTMSVIFLHRMERATTMKTMILAAAIGLSSLMLAGCVSESVSYDDGYYSRPRDYADRYSHDERWRDRDDYSGRRDYDRRDRGDEERRAERRDRDYGRGDDSRCNRDPRCEVPEYNEERPDYYRRG